MGAIFSSTDNGGDHRHVIRLQEKLWAAPSDMAAMTSSHASVGKILDTPDTSTDFRRSPRTATESTHSKTPTITELPTLESSRALSDSPKLESTRSISSETMNELEHSDTEPHLPSIQPTLHRTRSNSNDSASMLPNNSERY